MASDPTQPTGPEYLDPDPYIENETGCVCVGRISGGVWLFLTDETSSCSIGLSKDEVSRFKAGLDEAVGLCEWRLDDPDCGGWTTGCGHDFVLVEGTLRQNDMRFCCYCGKSIRVNYHEQA